MSYNQLIRYETGTLAANQNVGSIVAGITDFVAVGSTGACGVCVDYSGNIFISDSVDHVVMKCDRSGAVVLVAGLAGTHGNNGSNTVTGANARFNAPQGLCCDHSGNLYIADTGNHQIRVLDTNNNVSIVAGDPSAHYGYVDGANLDARFNNPHDIAVDSSGYIYVADGSNHVIRIIRGAQVFTIAGNGTSGNLPADYSTRSQGTAARFHTPLGVSVNRSGQVFVADSGNHKVKIIQPDGWVYNFSGSGASGTTVADAPTSQYQNLRFMDIDRSGSVYVVDYSTGGATSRLVKIALNGTPGVVIDFNATEGNYVTSVAVDQSGALYLTESVTDLQASSSSNSSSSTILKSSSSSTASSASSKSSSSTAAKSSSSSSTAF